MKILILSNLKIVIQIIVFLTHQKCYPLRGFHFKINEGDTVIHQTLGEALVLKTDGTGANEVVHLQFRDGVKQLNVNYAPLFPKEV